jgi:hypothetical protein
MIVRGVVSGNAQKASVRTLTVKTVVEETVAEKSQKAPARTLCISGSTSAGFRVVTVQKALARSRSLRKIFSRSPHRPRENSYLRRRLDKRDRATPFSPTRIRGGITERESHRPRQHTPEWLTEY